MQKKQNPGFLPKHFRQKPNPGQVYGVHDCVDLTYCTIYSADYLHTKVFHWKAYYATLFMRLAPLDKWNRIDEDRWEEDEQRERGKD